MDSFMKYIGRVNRCSNFYRERLFKDIGLFGPQCLYLVKICCCPGISQDQLAKSLYVSKSNVTRQLERLECGGFITRSVLSSDRRVMQVFPTDKASDLMPRILKGFSEWNSLLTEGLSKEEQDQLLGLLERIYQNAERAVAAGEPDGSAP